LPEKITFRILPLDVCVRPAYFEPALVIESETTAVPDFQAFTPIVVLTKGRWCRARKEVNFVEVSLSDFLFNAGHSGGQMKRSTDRILTTYAGSLPRPKDLAAGDKESLQRH
jgi:hypothetical protein